MARSHSSTRGIPHPLLIGALALIAMATFFGDTRGPFAGSGANRMAALEGIGTALAPDIPRQRGIDAPPRPLAEGAYTAHPSHFFTAEALILSRKTYRLDTEAAVSPVDLMLGWGPMSNPAVIGEIRMRQSRRFGYVRTGPDATVDLDAMSPYWTNAHMVPASDALAQALAGIEPGMVVRLEGALVDVEGPDGWWWETSTSRTDRGGGACEILLVTAITILR